MSLLNQAAAYYKMFQDKKITEKDYREKVDKIFLQAGRRSYSDSSSPLQNISKEPESLGYFIDPRIVDNEVSAAEKMIAGILDTYRLKYHQEVSMYGLMLPTGGYARYDFLLQVGYPYVLCEYDSVLHHSSKYQRSRDSLKTQWCIDRNIRLLRWNNKHYYHMEYEIEILLQEYNIKKM